MMDVFHEVTYKNRRIEVVGKDDALELLIDGKKILVTADLVGNTFSTPLRPYKTYPDLVSLARAVIRSRNWTGVSHEVAK